MQEQVQVAGVEQMLMAHHCFLPAIGRRRAINTEEGVDCGKTLPCPRVAEPAVA